jgi:hypothetical protein
MLDQEQRLIEIHSLLVALPATEAPGALRPWQASFGLEIITIPEIDGTTGGKVQLTASDHTRAFPRPRVALGLPIGGAFTGYVGAAYIPPIQVNGVSSHLGGLEGGVAWSQGPWAAAVRGQAVYADSKSPVTDPSTRDTLLTTVLGGDLSGAYTFDLGAVRLTPYAGVGVVWVDGHFTVESDGHTLTSQTTRPALGVGLRAFGWKDLEAVAEFIDYPDRLQHLTVKLAWAPAFGAQRP